MRPRRVPVGSTWAVAAFAAAAMVLVVVAGFFLNTTQDRQRRDLRERYADRTVVAAGLVDALFAVAYAGQVGDLGRQLGGPAVPAGRLDLRVKASNAAWGAVVDRSGRVVGASSGAPRAVLQRMAGQRFVRQALRPGGYGLGDASGDVLPSAVGFPTPSGWRAYVSATPRTFIRAFLDGTLRPLPGVEEARAYLFDGSGRQLAAIAQGTDIPARTPELLGALRRAPRGTFEVDSGERFYASHPIRHSDWRLVVTVSTDVLYATASGGDRAVPWIILGVTALALLLVAALLWRLTATARALATANRDLEDANRELARSNSDLEQFAYVASHDLSEPLRTVAGFSQLLGKRYRGTLDANADLFIDHMNAGVKRMQELIDDLLLYSRVGRAPVGDGAVDLDEVLGEVLQAIEPAIRDRAAQIVSDELPTVRGEHGQLRQVLQNLLVNALKFTAPDVTPRVHLGAEREGDCWRITVADNGIGVAPDKREQIFKMFGRLHTTDAFPGTGIGLALVKRIVERHGGRIWVEPGRDGGSIFAFTLPDRAPVAEAEPTTAGAPA